MTKTWVCVCGLLVSDFNKAAHVLCDVVALRVRAELIPMIERLRRELLNVENLRAPCDLYISQALIGKAVAEADALLKRIEFPSKQSTDPATSGVGTARAGDQRLVKGGGSHGE